MFRITTNFCLKFLLLLNIFNGIHAKTKETLQTSNDQVQPQLTPTSSNEPCNSIKDGTSFDKFENCKMDNNYIGNLMDFVRLDFSKAQENQITNFFDRAKDNAYLYAAVRLVDNKNIVNVNFGNVKTWTAPAKMPDGTVIIEISNNLKMETFLIEQMEKFDFGTDVKVKVFVYNNPILSWNAKTVEKIKNKMTDDSFFETEQFACTFQNPQDKKQSIKPNPELLPNCKIFRGDLKLESVSLSGEITFKDGCLHLVKVNMENVTAITAEADKGGKKCELAGVQPKIEDNPHLCGNKMAMVAAYTPNITPKLDDTCTIICKDQDKVNDKFYRCGKIETEYLDYKHWFEPGYERIADKLTEAKGISIRDRGNVEKIDFPVLTTVENLVISNNSALKTLDLKALLKAKTLTIKNNPQLTLNEIKKLSKKLIKDMHSEIECIVTESTIVTDIEALRHCTKIIGPMIIRYAKNDVDPANFYIKEVTDCLTIEDTKLTNLRFLEFATFGCTQTQKLKNNPKLCKPELLGQDGAAIDHQNGKTTECGKRCTMLSDRNCIIFEGDLNVDDKTLPAYLDFLEIVYGSLTITSGPRSIEFPVLTSIISSKAPALHIRDNKILWSIKMPKIERIEAGGEHPIVLIERSPELEDLKLFLPAKIADTCSRSNTTSCQYDRAEIKEDNWLKDNIRLLIGIAVGVVILAVAACVGLCFYKRYKNKKKSKAKVKTPVAQGKTPVAQGKTPVAKVKTPVNEDEGGKTIVDKSPTYEVIDAIQTRYPKANNTAYLHNIAESVVPLIHGPLQFRILLRTQITDADVSLGKISKLDYSYYTRVKDKNRKIDTERQRLNRHVYLVNEQYQYNLPEFKNAMLTAVQKEKVDKKQEKKKEPTKEKKLDEKKTEKERTKAGKSKEDGGKKKEKKETEKKKETTEKSTKKTEKLTMKSAAVSEASGENPTSSATPKTKTPDGPQKIKLIHIGPGFRKAMKFVENLKISPLTDASGNPYRKVSDKFPSLRTTLVLMELTEGNVTHTREVELTEMILPELVIGQLHNLIQCPWISLLYYAWQNNIVIHTSVTDYLVCSFYFYTAIDLLNNRIKKEMDTSKVEDFSLSTLYPLYHEMIAAKGQKDFDEITAYTIYIACMLEWLREQIQKDNVVAIGLKQTVQYLLVADQIIYTRWKMKKTDKIQWDTYCRDVADVSKHPFKAELESLDFYKNFPDETPYHLPLPGDRLKYWPIVEYDENLDNLMKEVDTPSMLQRPILSCSIKTEGDAKTVDSFVEGGEAPKPGEQKKTEEKKEDKNPKKEEQTDQGKPADSK